MEIYVVVVHIAIEDISACEIVVVVVDVLHVERIRSKLHERPI